MLVLLIFSGCEDPFDSRVLDEGFGVEGSGNCLDISTTILNFGTFEVGSPPEAQSTTATFICTSANLGDWSLDDPDDVFTMTEFFTGSDEVEFTVQPTATVPGEWEAQIIVGDGHFQETTQIFATSTSPEEEG